MDFIRRTLVHVLIVLLMLFGLSLVFPDNPVRADRASCEQIRTACKNAGFVLGGGARDGLLLDCFQSDRPRDSAAQVGIDTLAGHKPASGERMSRRETTQPPSRRLRTRRWCLPPTARPSMIPI